MWKFLLAGLVATASFAFGTAEATPIAGGGTVTASMVQPGNVTVLATYNNVAFTSQAVAGMASTFSGTYTAAVFRDTNNSLCGIAGQCLTFGIQVNNGSTSSDGIETVSTGPFSSLFAYNVGYNNANGGKAPLYISDSPYGAISFNFTSVGNTSNVLAPGQSSDYLLIQSSATNYTTGNVSFQDSQTATVAGFIPVLAAAPAVPEPATWGMVILGMGMIGYALRRRVAAGEVKSDAPIKRPAAGEAMA